VTESSEGESVGYRQPPKGTRWNTGQSGNQRRTKAKPKPAESSLAVIERLLFEPVEVVKNGEPTRMSSAVAIINQLMQKSFSGEKRAARVLQKYAAFANRDGATQLEIVFIDNEYTAALSASGHGDNNV
jgi:hypothetical protein